MRQIINPQRELEEVRIEAIKLDLKCRDEFPVLLRGLQYPYADEETRARLFALLEDQVLPATINQNTGRPGMELWRIRVMALLKQGLGVDYDRLHDLVNQQPSPSHGSPGLAGRIESSSCFPPSRLAGIHHFNAKKTAIGYPVNSTGI